MKTNRMILFLALALLAALLSACGGSPVATTWPGLAASEETAYLANGSIVYAIRLSDGEELWSFPEKPSAKLIFYSNPVFISDGQLLVGSSGTDHTLFLLDPETGNEIWSFTEANNHWVASPLVVGDMVYAPNADGTLYIFDMSIEEDDKLTGTVELGGRLWGQPATDGTLLFLTSLDHKVFAVDPQKKTVVWEVELDGAIAGSALAGPDGKIYVGSFGTTLEAIDIATHKITWTAPTEGWLWGGPVLDGGTLYFGDLDGNFYSVNAADGTIIDSSKPDGAILAAPLFLNGQVIFVTENGTVYSLTPGEDPQSMEKLDGKLYTAPVAAGNLLLIAPFQGEFLLVALDLDGKEEWHYPMEQK